MAIIRCSQEILTLEHIFMRLRTQTGLFFLGAGASAGSSPLGWNFWSGAPQAYLRKGSFPAIVTPRALLTQRMIDFLEIANRNRFLDRHLCTGIDERLFHEILMRLPDLFAREMLKHDIARSLWSARTEGTITDSYRVFRAFYPSVIANYNHDGLAGEFCGSMHKIVNMHGTIDPAYGSREMGAWIANLCEFDMCVPPDDLVMGVPESWTDADLYRRLSWIMSKAPRHVTIIGYSFAQMGNGYDDSVTLACFVQKFKNFRGTILVISPEPTQLCEMLSDALEIKTVYPIKRYWNLLAHAYLETQRNPERFPSLDYAHGFLFDQYGSDQVFPILSPQV